MSAKIGDVFGRLTAIGFDRDPPVVSRRASFRCVCGTEKEIRLAHVIKGITTSCGCAKRKHVVTEGQVFGRLTVIDATLIKSKQYQKVMCRCECGVEKLISTIWLATNVTKSCGCLVKEQISALSFKHGEEKTPLYGVWHSMKTRCENPGAENYSRYGGRGISVCEEWRESYIKFRNWSMDAGYEQGLQLDRKDNEGNYEPGNCRYVTPMVNANNRGNHVWLTAFGETKTMSDWSRDPRCAVSGATLKHRIGRGSFSHEDAITEEAKKGPHGKSRLQKELRDAA